MSLVEDIKKFRAWKRLEKKGLYAELRTAGEFSGNGGYWAKVMFKVPKQTDYKILEDFKAIFGEEE